MFENQANIRGHLGHIALLLAMYLSSVGTIFEFMWELRLNLGCQALEPKPSPGPFGLFVVADKFHFGTKHLHVISKMKYSHKTYE